MVQSTGVVGLKKELLQIRGLMRLLMKQRNGYVWTEQDRLEIRLHLRQLARVSPYLILFLMPGGFFLLPVLAWWMERRRCKRQDEVTRRVVDK